MKSNLKFFLLAPFFMAILCESVDDTCGVESPEAYVVNVENIAESYAVDETIFINSQISSQLVNTCTPGTEPELIVDNTIFIDGVFVLKLNSSLTNLNAEVSQDYTVIYSIGEAANIDACTNSIRYLPELADDNSTYNYRLGISINTPGDYCIVNAQNNAFNTEQENNAQIFDAYNTLGDVIKFSNCGTTFTRNGTDNFYFFTVE
nr:hypothetical protein [uncultured Psychroserpens sp.]